MNELKLESFYVFDFLNPTTDHFKIRCGNITNNVVNLKRYNITCNNIVIVNQDVNIPIATNTSIEINTSFSKVPNGLLQITISTENDNYIIMIDNN